MTEIGLTEAEARQRLATVGANLPAEAAVPFLRRLLARFWGPVPWLLEVAILLQRGLGQYAEAGLITGPAGVQRGPGDDPGSLCRGSPGRR